MRKKPGILSGVLACVLVLTACGSQADKTGERSRMVRLPAGTGMAQEWLGSGRYEADGKGRVRQGMSKKGREFTQGAKSAVDDVRQGAMDAGEEFKDAAGDAGRDMKGAAKDAGRDLKKAAGK